MHSMILISTIMFWSLVLKNKKTCFLSCITICMSYHHAVVWHQIQKNKNLDIITQVSIVMHHTSSSHCLFWRNQFTRIILSTLLGLVVLFIHMNDLYSKPNFVLAYQAQFCLAHQAQFCNGPTSPVSYWPTKPNFVLAYQAQFCLAHQAQFCTGPLSLALPSTPSPISYWPNKPVLYGLTKLNLVLAHQAQLRIGPPSPISYWPNKPSLVLDHQAQSRTGSPSPALYWPTKPNFVLAQQAQSCTGPPSPVSYWPTKPISLGPLSLSHLTLKA